MFINSNTYAKLIIRYVILTLVEALWFNIAIMLLNAVLSFCSQYKCYGLLRRIASIATVFRTKYSCHNVLHSHVLTRINMCYTCIAM